jgi:arginyl-tRNA synthetase
VTPGELGDAVQAAAATALTALGAGPASVAGQARVRRPRHQEQGDYATPVALRLARDSGLPAARLATAIATELRRHPGVRQAEATGPGFISIWLTPQASGDLAGVIVASGRAYGHSARLAGQRFLLDPAPSHPPPAATLSKARHAALASATARMLLAAGAGLTADHGPGVTTLRIPGPAPTRTRALPVPDGAPSALGQLVAEVEGWAAWYALVSWPPGVAVEIDVAVWARRTSASPAWAVRHARQRIAGLDRRAVAAGISPDRGYDPAMLDAHEEAALLGLLAEFPAMVAVAGQAGEPHRLVRYLEAVAVAWSACDGACPVLPRRGQPAPDLAAARLTLAQAASTVLANGLRLLGVPD